MRATGLLLLSALLADADGNIWAGGHSELGRISRSGGTSVFGQLPGLGDCMGYIFKPMAFDSSGGVWVIVKRDVPGCVGFCPPCLEGNPPLPDLVRFDMNLFLATHAAEAHIPALSPLMLVVLALSLAALAAFKLLHR